VKVTCREYLAILRGRGAYIVGVMPLATNRRKKYKDCNYNKRYFEYAMRVSATRGAGRED